MPVSSTEELAPTCLWHDLHRLAAVVIGREKVFKTCDLSPDEIHYDLAASLLQSNFERSHRATAWSAERPTARCLPNIG